MITAIANQLRAQLGRTTRINGGTITLRVASARAGVRTSICASICAGVRAPSKPTRTHARTLFACSGASSRAGIRTGLDASPAMGLTCCARYTRLSRASRAAICFAGLAGPHLCVRVDRGGSPPLPTERPNRIRLAVRSPGASSILFWMF
jgi:hypothetical protein